MPTEPTLTRAQKIAERRVEKWMAPPVPADVEGTAYRAMVESLLGAMNAVGPTDAMTGITALTKTLALMIAAALRLEDDGKVEEICSGQGAWIANEVMALRKAMSPSKKRNTDMAEESIRSFLVSYGFAVDDASRSRAEAGTKAAEDRITAANAAAVAKRLVADKTAQTERIRVALAAGQQITADDRRFVLEQEKNRVAASDADKRRREDEAKKGRIQREEMLKEVRATALKVAGVITGIAAAVSGATGGILYATDRAAKAFERLTYVAQNSGTSVRGLQAFGYGIAQLGGNAEAAQAQLAEFGTKLATFPQFTKNLESMGIATRDAGGHMRDAADIAADYMDKLAKMPRAQQDAMGEMYGFDPTTIRAGTRPGLHSYMSQERANQAQIGANADEAGERGAAFERSMRTLQDDIQAVKTRIETALFGLFKPALDTVAKWIEEHGKAISANVIEIAKGISDVVSAFVNTGLVKGSLKAMSDGLETFAGYINSGDFKKDVKGFVADIVALARSVRTALEWLGVIPSRAASPVVPEPTGSLDDHQFSGGGASIRNRRSHDAHGYTDFDAVQGKKTGFGGGDQSHVSTSGKVGDLAHNSYATQENADAIKSAAKELGTTPEDLATVIGYETAGTFSPSKIGGAGNRYQGLIQFGPTERAQYGANGNQTFVEQMQAVKRYLKDRGFKPGMGLMDLYSTINAGSPGHYDRSDGNGTVRSHVANMEQHMAPTARAFLARGSQETGVPSTAAATATVSPHTITDTEVLASRQRLAAGGNDPADHATEAAYLKQQNTPTGDASHPSQERTLGNYIKKAGPLFASGKIGNPTNQHPGQLDPARQKLATLMLEAEHAKRHLLNLQIVRAAQHGLLNPLLSGRAIGDTEATRRAVHNSVKHGNTASINHSPTYNVHTSDAKSGLDAAKRQGERGTADLVRNIQPMLA